MKRLLAVFAFGLVVGAGARADLIPPGTRNIAIEHKIATDKDYAEWSFFVVAGSGGIKAVKLDAKTPLVIPGSTAVGNGPVPDENEKRKALQLPYRSNLLVAIPTATVKTFPSEKELHAAVWGLKVEGMASVKNAFGDHENAKATAPRKSVVRAFRVNRIDAKDGIVLEAIKAEDKPGKEEEDPVAGAYPWIAGGLSLAGAVGVAGLWVSRRSRQH